MKKHLFLTGLSGCGKSTMIRKALGEKLSYAGGFVTERMRSAEGTLLGYDLFPAAAAAGVQGFEGLRFLDYSCNPPRSDNEIFRNEAVRLLNEAQLYPYIMLDEFGGYELIIPQFREALLDVLNCDVPCIGVLKGAPNAMQLKKRLGLGERYTAYRDALEDALRRDSDTMVLEVRTWDDSKALEAVNHWCREYAL